MLETTIGVVGPQDLAYAAGVLARGMRDNPNHVAAMGSDPDYRVRVFERGFRGALASMKTPPICVRRGQVIIGVSGLAPPGACKPSLTAKLRMLPMLASVGPRRMKRLVEWMSAWGKRDRDEPHWHLGPVAVDLPLQRLGFGGLMLEEYCRRVDAAGGVGYLETDKKENLAFYERYGFEIVDEAVVIGQPNWFMRRPPSA